jgi:uncharacterized protein (UPF0333 family)
MKKKINIKMIVIFAVLLVVIVLGVVGVGAVRTFMSGATSGTEPKGAPTAVSSADGKSATVTWTADKESTSSVIYGTTAASLVLTAVETNSTTDHNVSLTSLRPGTKYWFKVIAGGETYDNGGTPYSFQTSGEDTANITPTEAVVPTDTTLPLEQTPVGTTSATPTGACDPKVDYNKDGVVNSFDLAECKKNGGAVTSSTLSPTVTTTTTNSVCSGSNLTDLNNDGIINSVDRIKCLQSQKL